jgi:hypothetical protein
MTAYASPEGPAVFQLSRNKGETSINIVVKNPSEAAKAGVLPPPGRVKLFFGNIGEKEAAITIAEKTIKIAPGTGGPQKPDGPTMELRPGKYKYAVKVAGQPVRSEELDVSADDAWGLMVGPGGAGVLALQMY